MSKQGVGKEQQQGASKQGAVANFDMADSPASKRRSKEKF
jgi:hypothetical protein